MLEFCHGSLERQTQAAFRIMGFGRHDRRDERQRQKRWQPAAEAADSQEAREDRGREKKTEEGDGRRRLPLQCEPGNTSTTLYDAYQGIKANYPHANKL